MTTASKYYGVFKMFYEINPCFNHLIPFNFADVESICNDCGSSPPWMLYLCVAFGILFLVSCLFEDKMGRGASAKLRAPNRPFSRRQNFEIDNIAAVLGLFT